MHTYPHFVYLLYFLYMHKWKIIVLYIHNTPHFFEKEMRKNWMKVLQNYVLFINQ